MKALVYTATQTMIYRDEPEPQVKPGQVKIQVAASAICGSDMHAYHGHDERRVPPLILGHEVAGTVIDGQLDGQRVVVNPLMTCGICRYCQSGRANLCQQRNLIGMYLAGAYAEYLVIDERNVVAIPDTMSAVTAALTEPTATAMHAIALVEKISDRPISEQRTLIIGGGAIGLLAALILKSKGCQTIDLAETNALRQQTARREQFGYVFNPVTVPTSALDDYDLVLDCVGSGTTRQLASQTVAPGGIISHVGLLNNKEGIDLRRITLQEITVLGNYCYTYADIVAAIALLASGHLGDLQWVETRPLSEGAKAFADLHHNQVAAAKIVLQPDHCFTA
jgi:2-desacetyl-2-hydroxyethyl bacteriochlorophyllide A dehydrogenase